MICARCTSQIRHLFKSLPELMRELRDARHRITRFGRPNGGGGRRGADFVGPVPWDDRAASATRDLAAAVGAWLVELDAGDLYERSVICTCRPYQACNPTMVRVDFTPGGTWTAWSSWLLSRIPRIRAHQSTPAMLKQVESAVEQVYRVIDRPVDLEYVCLCSVCGFEVYAPKGATEAVCRECRRVAPRTDAGDIVDPDAVPVYVTADERVRRLTAVRSSLLPAEDIKTAVALSWAPVNRKTITSWINRGRLRPLVCRVSDRVELFYVGDALNLAAQIPGMEAGADPQQPEPQPKEQSEQQPRRRRVTRHGQEQASA